jgi:hypothetical protein
MIDCPSRLTWFTAGGFTVALAVLLAAAIARRLNGLPADPTESSIRRPGEGGLL